MLPLGFGRLSGLEIPHIVVHSVTSPVCIVKTPVALPTSCRGHMIYRYLCPSVFPFGDPCGAVSNVDELRGSPPMSTASECVLLLVLSEVCLVLRKNVGELNPPDLLTHTAMPMDDVLIG